MMVKFMNPTPDVTITVRCRLLAPNTDQEPDDVFVTVFDLRIIENLNITSTTEEDTLYHYGPTKPTEFDKNATGTS